MMMRGFFSLFYDFNGIIVVLCLERKRNHNQNKTQITHPGNPENKTYPHTHVPSVACVTKAALFDAPIKHAGNGSAMKRYTASD